MKEYLVKYLSRNNLNGIILTIKATSINKALEFADSHISQKDPIYEIVSVTRKGEEISVIGAQFGSGNKQINILS